MGYVNVITPLVAKALKLLAMVIPLSILALLSIMAVQAHNEMGKVDFGGNFEIVSSPAKIEMGKSETGGLSQSTRPGR